MQHSPVPMDLAQARELAGLLPGEATLPPNNGSEEEEVRQQTSPTGWDATTTTISGVADGIVVAEAGSSLRSRFAVVARGNDKGRKDTRRRDRVLVGRRVNLAEEAVYADNKDGAKEPVAVPGADSLLPIRR